MDAMRHSRSSSRPQTECRKLFTVSGVGLGAVILLGSTAGNWMGAGGPAGGWICAAAVPLACGAAEAAACPAAAPSGALVAALLGALCATAIGPTNAHITAAIRNTLILNPYSYPSIGISAEHF